MKNTSSDCNLCPRECNINRNEKLGFCQSPDELKIARAALHHWEEPCISGQYGSGTVFFCGCNLGCVYCQNHEISRGKYGKEISVSRLAEIFLELQSLGAHNINLVTPTHYTHKIIEAIDYVKNKINIPFVWNTSGYEKIETIKLLKNYIDIYLCDIKYYSPEVSQKYSFAANYFECAISALGEMIRQTSAPEFDRNGIMKSGVIVRHLVLPSYRQESILILQELARRFKKTDFLLSLMSQYTPNKNTENFKEINRRITSFEYNSVIDEALRLGFDNAFMQERTSADKSYTPPFDLQGV